MAAHCGGMHRSYPVLVLLAHLAACVNNSGNTSVTCAPLSATLPTPPAAWSGSVFIIVMENKNRGEILGNPRAPYINQLASQGALATGYHDPFVHPSEPNYLWMVAGQNFGVLDDGDPGSHHLATTSHLADQLDGAGISWKSYQDGMGEPCGVKSHGRYAAKHNPFVYFDDVTGWDGQAFHPELRCNAHVVDYSQLDIDLAQHTLPRYVFITPSLDNDMHDGSIADGDAWLAREVPKLVASDAFQSGALFLLWDEGSGHPTGDEPPFMVISPHAKPGYVSTVDYDTSSFLKTVQNMLGLEPLPCSAVGDTVSSMTDLFTVPLTAAP